MKYFIGLVLVLFLLKFSRIYGGKSCDMLVVVDETLFVSFNRDVGTIINIVDEHIDKVNDIYRKSVFTKHYSDYFFYAKTIEIWNDFCPDCNQTQLTFLQEFSNYVHNYKTKEYCMAVMFTHRDFPLGLQGLAYRSKACEDSFNTAFVTFLNHQIQAKKFDSVLTLAHELGHSFGALHDQDTACKINAEQYIMSASGTSDQDLKFSSCSLKDINERMEEIRTSRRNCFQNRPELDYQDPSFCGNSKVEEGEECDCGLDPRDCNDPCCYPGLLTDEHRSDNSNARPCHRYHGLTCTKPWYLPLVYGVMIPWIIIGIVSVILSVILCIDWRKDKTLFKHYYAPVSQNEARSQNIIKNISSTQRDSSQRSSSSFTPSVLSSVPKAKSPSNLVNTNKHRYENLPNQRMNMKPPKIPEKPKPSEVVQGWSSPSQSTSFMSSSLSLPQKPNLAPKPNLSPGNQFKIDMSNIQGQKTNLRPTATKSYTTTPQRKAPPPPK